MGFLKFTLWKGKAPRALTATAVLNCSTAMLSPQFPRDEGSARGAFPGCAVPEKRHCHLLSTGCNRQAGSTQGQNLQHCSDPLGTVTATPGQQEEFGGDRNSLQAAQLLLARFVYRHHKLPLPRDEHPAQTQLRAASTNSGTNQTQTTLSYICMFIISKYSIYIRYSNTFENFIQKQVSTDRKSVV